MSSSSSAASGGGYLLRFDEETSKDLDVWGRGAVVDLHARGLKVAVRYARADDCRATCAKGAALEVNAARPTALFIHGAGQSSWSWTTTIRALLKVSAHSSQAKCNLVAYDLRGHGQSCANRSQERGESMGKDSLVLDCLALLAALTSNISGAKPLPLYLVGHSVGGALATWVAQALMRDQVRWKVQGLFVMDMVEETALKSMEHTRKVLENRPPGFASHMEAAQWALGKGILHHAESAKYSLAGQLRPTTSEEQAASPSFEHSSLAYTWRTNLLDYFEQWPTWVTGLSEAFVGLQLINKTILLAGIDSLDKPLIVAQMQGKFKLIVFSDVQVGHFVHEDAPDRTAAALDLFIHRATSLVVPPG